MLLKCTWKIWHKHFVCSSRDIKYPVEDWRPLTSLEVKFGPWAQGLNCGVRPACGLAYPAPGKLLRSYDKRRSAYCAVTFPAGSERDQRYQLHGSVLCPPAESGHNNAAVIAIGWLMWCSHGCLSSGARRAMVYALSCAGIPTSMLEIPR